MSRPDIHLYTASTMNGWKPLIFLHEGDIAYDMTPISFSEKE
jgi:GST-like protein